MQHLVISLLLGLSLFTPAFSQTEKSNDLLKRLLDLPAPAPGALRPSADSLVQERPDEFYRWKNIPPDDAPLEDLLEYWKGQRYQPATIAYKREMSAKTAERLLDHFKENPSLIYEYLGGFPTDEGTARSIRELHKLLSTGPERLPTSPLGEWLTNNTTDGIPALTKQVRKIRDKDDYVSNEFQIALKSLARLDWDAARPHVERLEADGSNPHSQILAYWVRYVHAIDAKETSDIDTYRRKLQKVVEDRSARWSQRDLAMDALVEAGDWDGRQEWYLSLFEDETLLAIQENGYTGMSTMMNGAASTEEWVDRFLRLLRSDNRAIRSTAARNLVKIYHDEKLIIEALLPWVSDPNWAKESRDGERGKIIRALGDHDFPAAVPALIAVLSNEEDHRLAAAQALAKKNDPRAGPVLRSLVAEETGEVRQAIIEALIASGAMSADEQMIDVEAFAVMSSTEAGRLAIESDAYRDYDDVEEDGEGASTRDKKKSSVPVEVTIGKVLAAAEEPDESLAVRVIEREKILRKKDPDVAAQLAKIISGWRGRPVFLEQLRQVRSGEANVDTVLNLLTERVSIREKLPNEIANLRASSGLMRGLGACIAENEDEFLSVTGGGDAESQITMLSCARLLRAKLPVNEIARMLDSPNGLLKLAAERYLESEDSVDARRFVLAKHPGEALILGARTAFIPEPKSPEINSTALASLFRSVSSGSYIAATPNLRKMESDLQTEIKSNKKLSVIFARLPEAPSGQQIIRVHDGRISYTYHEDTARYWTRDLTEKEYKAFYSFILANNIDGVPASLGECYHGCPSAEFIMLGREGGRRNFFSGYQSKGVLAGLDEYFDAFKASDLKLTYHLAEKIKGLEVIVADTKFPVHAVWKNESDLRFLVSDLELAENIQKNLAEKARVESEVEIDDDNPEEAARLRSERYAAQEKRRLEMSGKELSWRTLENGKIGAAVTQPKELNLLPALGKLPLQYRSTRLGALPPGFADDVGVYANRYDNGLFKMQPSGEPVRIREGSYENPIVSADKRWVAISKHTEDKPSVVTRVNLQTGQEFPVNIPSAESVYPIAIVPTHNRILIYRGPTRSRDSRSLGMDLLEEEVGEAEEQTEPQKPSPPDKTPPQIAEYYLLDPATGATRQVKGEFRPIEERGYRPLQMSSTVGAAWAAIYDPKTNVTEVGLYTEKSFSFIPVTNLPGIRLGSSDIWVHEKENKIYFVYRGHLLAAPLRQL